MEIGTQIAMTVAVVAWLRQHMPKLDGWLVPVIALLVATAVVFVMGGVRAPLEIAQRAVEVAVGAVGGVRFATYLVDRHATQVTPPDVSNDIQPLAAADVTPILPPKGAA